MVVVTLIRMTKHVDERAPNKPFQDFITYKKSRNLSDETIDYYEEKLNRFLDWLDRNNMTVGDIDESIITRYIIHLQTEHDIRDTTINTNLRAIRAFVYYCQKLGYLGRFKVSLIKTTKKLKETYTDEEIRLLLEKPDTKTCSFAVYRNWVLVNFLLATGVRLATMVNVKICDLDFAEYWIKLRHTKNKRQQLIPMSRTLLKVLQEYLMYRGGEEDDFLFCSQNTGEKLSKSGMQKAIKTYHLDRGINSYSVHKYRHTFAKIAVLNGVDVFTLMKILGHSSIKVTKEYINLFSEDLKKGFNDYCPLEHFSGSGKGPIKMR